MRESDRLLARRLIYHFPSRFLFSHHTVHIVGALNEVGWKVTACQKVWKASGATVLKVWNSHFHSCPLSSNEYAVGRGLICHRYRTVGTFKHTGTELCSVSWKHNVTGQKLEFKFKAMNPKVYGLRFFCAFKKNFCAYFSYSSTASVFISTVESFSSLYRLLERLFAKMDTGL